jgi:hypothetical protein
MFQSRKQQRRGHPDLIVVKASTPISDEPVRTRKCRGRTDAEHGQVVDADLTRAVSAGGRPPATCDPCALSLLAYLRDELEWRPVATQVPLYSENMNLSTAIDLLCVDRRTKELHLVEVKTTRSLTEQSRACYHANRASDNDKSIDPPLSRYVHHQLQLWAMSDIVTEEMGVRLGGACVLRTSPASVDRYPLHEWFTSNAQRMRRMLAAVTA